jgi:hypothetical protein
MLLEEYRDFAEMHGHRRDAAAEDLMSDEDAED